MIVYVVWTTNGAGVCIGKALFRKLVQNERVCVG